MITDIKKDIRDNTFFLHFLLHVITAEGTGDIEKIWPNVANRETTEIKLTVNGFEFDARVFVDHIEAQMNSMVQEAARDLVKEKLNQLADDLYNDGD